MSAAIITVRWKSLMLQSDSYSVLSWSAVWGLPNMWQLNWTDLNSFGDVRFEVFTAVTMKNGVFWDVPQRGSCKNRRFLQEPRCGTSQKTSFFIVTAVKTSNPTHNDTFKMLRIPMKRWGVPAANSWCYGKTVHSKINLVPLGHHRELQLRPTGISLQSTNTEIKCKTTVKQYEKICNILLQSETTANGDIMHFPRKKKNMRHQRTQTRGSKQSSWFVTKLNSQKAVPCHPCHVKRRCSY
jgi:hypothetical protein